MEMTSTKVTTHSCTLLKHLEKSKGHCLEQMYIQGYGTIMIVLRLSLS